MPVRRNQFRGGGRAGAQRDVLVHGMPPVGGCAGSGLDLVPARPGIDQRHAGLVRILAGDARQFCGTCGTGLFYLNEDIFPGQIDIQAAAFADADAFPPGGHIQVADAPRWMAAIGDLPRFARYPDGAS